MNKKEKEIYKIAIGLWGVDSQIDMAIEECAELIKALVKRKRKINGFNDYQVCMEIADVQIILNQLRLIYSSKLIDKIKVKKLEKLKRLEMLEIVDYKSMEK